MKSNLFLASSAMLLAMLAAAPAAAQTAPSPAAAPAEDAETANNNEIIVTANKREQALNDVGLTITAATGEALGQRGIKGPEDLAKLVPGFTFTQSLYSTPVYTLRGIGLYDATFGAAPSVSIYTDEVPRNVPVMSDGLDLDVERSKSLRDRRARSSGRAPPAARSTIFSASRRAISKPAATPPMSASTASNSRAM